MRDKYCDLCLPLVINQTATIVETIEEMIKDWELALGPADKTLYSLGLRRSLDIIKEHMEGDHDNV